MALRIKSRALWDLGKYYQLSYIPNHLDSPFEFLSLGVPPKMGVYMEPGVISPPTYSISQSSLAFKEECGHRCAELPAKAGPYRVWIGPCRHRALRDPY